MRVARTGDDGLATAETADENGSSQLALAGAPETAAAGRGCDGAEDAAA